MGPAMVERFRAAGADVVADERDLTGAGAVDELLAEVGSLDVVIANAIAQNFVENPAYYPAGVLEDETMRRWIERHNPSGRLAAPGESAELAVFLAGPGSDFLYGQVIPFAGGSAVNV